MMLELKAKMMTLRAAMLMSRSCFLTCFMSNRMLFMMHGNVRQA